MHRSTATTDTVFDTSIALAVIDDDFANMRNQIRHESIATGSIVGTVDIERTAVLLLRRCSPAH
jgi:hypothetical protein